jgi:ElaA protein
MLSWNCARLEALPALALYEVLALRSLVFVLEQRCLYLDPDGLDLQCWHLQGRGPQGELQAYARLLPPQAKGAPQGLPMIGRVVTAPSARGGGQGRALMQRAIEECARLWPGQGLAIGAQAHLQRFYASLGFVPTSAPYDEDGILHIDMTRPGDPA